MISFRVTCSVIVSKTVSDMVEIFAVKLNRDIKGCEFESLLRLVSKEKKYRIQRFNKHKNSQMCLLADILIRKIIIDKCNIDNQEITFIKGINGKPELNKLHNYIKFNCSHSGN